MYFYIIITIRSHPCHFKYGHNNIVHSLCISSLPEKNSFSWAAPGAHDENMQLISYDNKSCSCERERWSLVTMTTNHWKNNGPLRARQQVICAVAAGYSMKWLVWSDWTLRQEHSVKGDQLWALLSSMETREKCHHPERVGTSAELVIIYNPINLVTYEIQTCVFIIFDCFFHPVSI